MQSMGSPLDFLLQQPLCSLLSYSTSLVTTECSLLLTGTRSLFWLKLGQSEFHSYGCATVLPLTGSLALSQSLLCWASLSVGNWSWQCLPWEPSKGSCEVASVARPWGCLGTESTLTAAGRPQHLPLCSSSFSRAGALTWFVQGSREEQQLMKYSCECCKVS